MLHFLRIRPKINSESLNILGKLFIYSNWNDAGVFNVTVKLYIMIRGNYGVNASFCYDQASRSSNALSSSTRRYSLINHCTVWSLLTRSFNKKKTTWYYKHNACQPCEIGEKRDKNLWRLGWTTNPIFITYISLNLYF